MREVWQDESHDRRVHLLRRSLSLLWHTRSPRARLPQEAGSIEGRRRDRGRCDHARVDDRSGGFRRASSDSRTSQVGSSASRGQLTKEPGIKTVGAVEFIVDSGSEATILNTGLADKHGVDRAASSASLYQMGGGDLNCSTRGSLHVQLRDEKWRPFPVALEFHVGDVQRNVLSVSRLVDQGCNVSFGPDGCWIRHQGRCVNLHRQGGLFTLRVERPSGREGQEAQMVAPVAMDDAEDEPSDELPE